MSVDYNVAVHAATWPSSAALQACMGRLHYPVVLKQATREPFMAKRSGLGLFARFKGRAVELEASAVKLSPTSFYGYTFDRAPDFKSADGSAEIWQGRLGEKMKGVDVNDDLRKIGAKNVHFGYGDYVLTLSFHSQTDEIRAGLLIMAGMVKCFGGYGFELQGPSHGTGAYADGLATDALNDAAWKKSDEE